MNNESFAISLSELRKYWKAPKPLIEAGYSRGIGSLSFRLTVWILRAMYWERRALRAERAQGVTSGNHNLVTSRASFDYATNEFKVGGRQ